MQITETANSGLKREYKVVIGKDELTSKLDDRLKDMAARANIKGFRPGKVPVPHLKRMYGKSVMAEVVQQAVDDEAKKVLTERNLKPAYQPEVTLPENEAEVAAIMDGKGDLAFTMAFEVIPHFELQDTSGLELTRHMAEVEDKDVDEMVQRLANDYKNFASKDGAADRGDRVVISFVGKIDGKAFDGGTAQDVPLELGSGQFIPGFEEQLIGAKSGDDKLVKVEFPADYGVKNLASKPAEFEVKVSAVEAVAETKIDDAFAKTLGFDDLSKLREMVKGRINSEISQMSGMKLKRDVLDALDKQYAFELPQKLVEAEFNGIWSTLSREMERAKKSFADENTTEEDARKEYRGIAERRVRLGLVLGTLGEKEGVQVNEQELQQALMQRVRQFPGQEKQVFDYYKNNPAALVELRGPIFEQKVVDLLVSKARVADKTVSREELRGMVQEEDEDDHAGHDHA